MKISQAEARRLKRRVEELELILREQRSAWVSDWPRGTHILSFDADTEGLAVFRTARLLKHAVVVTERGGTLRCYALPLAEGTS